MILIVGVFAGWIIGLLIHLISKRPYHLKGTEILVDSFFSGWTTVDYISNPFNQDLIPDQLARIILIGSQLGLIIFSVMNLKHWPFWVLTVGLEMNFAVISLNGGLMPLSPENAAWLVPNAPTGSWETGQRFGVGKDIVLLPKNTNLNFFSDQFHLQLGLFKAIYSLGDVFIATGAFLFMLGDKPSFSKNSVKKKEISNEFKY